jgi:8-oxo-dGTP pyrophosphatase MutT (NUDIX family)
MPDMNSIDVTVAAVIERRNQFLMVEERANGDVVFNQPAGHLEPGESLVEAVIRETLEETGIAFEPRHVLGVYLWRSEQNQRSFLRVSFCGTVARVNDPRPLDSSIIAAHWLDYPDIVARAAQLRSPMVMRCIQDYLNGIRYPLACLTSLLPAAAAESLNSASRRAV